MITSHYMQFPVIFHALTWSPGHTSLNQSHLQPLPSSVTPAATPLVSHTCKHSPHSPQYLSPSLLLGCSSLSSARLFQADPVSAPLGLCVFGVSPPPAQPFLLHVCVKTTNSKVGGCRIESSVETQGDFFFCLIWQWNVNLLFLVVYAFPVEESTVSVSSKCLHKRKPMQSERLCQFNTETQTKLFLCLFLDYSHDLGTASVSPQA